MNNCYICGQKNANKPLVLKDSFTAHTRCKCPDSKHLCQRCYDCIDGEFKQCWYFHPKKEQWSKLWGRNWSWLVCNDADTSFPSFSTPPFDDGLLRVENLPTRENIREWLINPPTPPFTICIAVSGQKHTYPFSLEANSQELFPVLLEETIIYWEREKHTDLLNTFETLMQMGFSKTEIVSGNYHLQKLLKTKLIEFFPLEEKMKDIRGTHLFNLLEFVAISNLTKT